MQHLSAAAAAADDDGDDDEDFQSPTELCCFTNSPSNTPFTIRIGMLSEL